MLINNIHINPQDTADHKDDDVLYLFVYLQMEEVACNLAVVMDALVEDNDLHEPEVDLKVVLMVALMVVLMVALMVALMVDNVQMGEATHHPNAYFFFNIIRYRIQKIFYKYHGPVGGYSSGLWYPIKGLQSGPLLRSFS